MFGMATSRRPSSQRMPTKISAVRPPLEGLSERPAVAISASIVEGGRRWTAVQRLKPSGRRRARCILCPSSQRMPTKIPAVRPQDCTASPRRVA